MKRNLLVTFADKNYLDQAKQLFSSAHFRGGWDGDYMVISPDVTEEQKEWFDKKGIIVKRFSNPVKEINLDKFPGTLYSIFYLFTEEFKKWSHVIYFDVDVLIRDRFDELLKVKTFAASEDILSQKLKYQFKKRNVINQEYSPSKHLGITDQEYKTKKASLERKYNLNKKMFSAGIFVINTDIITKNTFNELLGLAKDFGKISHAPPQGEINLLFYQKWERLPFAYNVYPYYWNKFYNLSFDEIDGIFLHFAATLKPWDKNNYYYSEWKENYEKADSIDLSRPIKIHKKWNDEAILELDKKIKKIHLTKGALLLSIHRILGESGILLKKINPGLYFALKKFFKPSEKKFTK